MRGLRIRESEYYGASARGQFARGTGERTPTSWGRADISGRVQREARTPSAVRQADEGHRERGQAHHHEARSDSAESDTGRTVARDAK